MSKALESPVMQVSSASPLVVTIPDPVNIEFPGPGLFYEFSGASTPGTPQTLISQVIPPGVLIKLRRVEVVSRAYSEFTVLAGVAVIKEGKTSPDETTVSLPFDPWHPSVNPEVIQVKYSQIDGPAIPIRARLYYTQE